MMVVRVVMVGSDGSGVVMVVIVMVVSDGGGVVMVVVIVMVVRVVVMVVD